MDALLGIDMIRYCGLYFRGKNGRTAVIQIKPDRDMLSPELVEYYGPRDRSKKTVRKLLKKEKYTILGYLRAKYAPTFSPKYIVVE